MGYQSSAAVAAAEDNEERDDDDPDALVIEDVAKAVVHNIIPPVFRPKIYSRSDSVNTAMYYGEGGFAPSDTIL